jgi:hypothetical protein
LRQDMRSVVHRYLILVHRFQQCALRLGCGAIDFIRQHDVGEDRSGPELEAVGLLAVDTDADDVGRQHVRSKLDAMKSAVERAGQGVRQGRLSYAGHVFD